MIFRRVDAADRLADIRYEAEKQYIEHQTAAAHHQALADMYKGRMDWVDNQTSEQPVALRRAS
jgi:hypothetical protein